MNVGQIFVTVGRLGKTLGGIKKPMKRKFIGERGTKASPEVPQYRHVLYTLDEAFESMIPSPTIAPFYQSSFSFSPKLKNCKWD